jgi:hypothetical protein
MDKTVMRNLRAAKALVGRPMANHYWYFQNWRFDYAHLLNNRSIFVSKIFSSENSDICK